MTEDTDHMRENPLGRHNPAELLKQGLSPDTIVNGEETVFTLPSIEELAAIFPEYEIIEMIGQGGMGAVYKICQRELDRIVALKIMPSELAGNPAFAEQFAREAKALAKLNNPHIVTLYEYGCRQGLYYIVMEYVRGTNLRVLMENGRVAPREALSIVAQICDALQYAHDRGVVHRDIKPENILVDWEGSVKVADFGLVKMLSASLPVEAGTERISSGNETETLVSRDGRVMGTPAYMAPEQLINPKEVDHRADIYALGVVFYQMLTGELPDQPVKIAPSRKVSIDVKLDDVVLRALEREPGRRYQQAGSMKTRIEQSEQNSREPQQKRSWVYRVAIGTLVVVGVLVGITAIIGGVNYLLYMAKSDESRTEAHATRLTEKSEQQEQEIGWDVPLERIQTVPPEDALNWLKLIDQRRYSEAYKELADFGKAIISEKDWNSMLDGFMKPLGKMVNRKLYSSRILNSMPGAPDGEYLLIEFDTEFENKKNARETVTFVFDDDQNFWAAAGYYIK